MYLEPFNVDIKDYQQGHKIRLLDKVCLLEVVILLIIGTFLSLYQWRHLERMSGTTTKGIISDVSRYIQTVWSNTSVD